MISALSPKYSGKKDIASRFIEQRDFSACSQRKGVNLLLRLEECENLLHHRIALFRGADTLEGEAQNHRAPMVRGIAAKDDASRLAALCISEGSNGSCVGRNDAVGRFHYVGRFVGFVPIAENICHWMMLGLSLKKR